MVALSGAGGSFGRAYEAKTGYLLWDLPLQPTGLGRLSEPGDIGSDIAFTKDPIGDPLLLSSPGTLKRIDRETGSVKWTWSPPDQESVPLDFLIHFSV